MNFEDFQFYDPLARSSTTRSASFASVRARMTLGQAAKLIPTIWLVDSQIYLECNYMVRHANIIRTDWGNITKKTTVEDGFQLGRAL